MNCKPKLIVFSLILLLLSSCWKEDNYVSEGVLLDFSADTMAFDTVFTQMGTTTRQFMVYNRSNQPVRIREVTL